MKLKESRTFKFLFVVYTLFAMLLVSVFAKDCNNGAYKIPNLGEITR